MKLSEILGWSKNPYKENTLVNTTFRTAITSCDREIDREALESILREEEGYIPSEAYEIAEAVISTMPTWLKRSE